MRTFFRAQDDPEMAQRFHDSSMEFVASLGGDPLSMVTELPLFLVKGSSSSSHQPERYLELRKKRPELRARLERGEDVRPVLDSYDLRPIPLKSAMQLQLRALKLGLQAVRNE